MSGERDVKKKERVIISLFLFFALYASLSFSLFLPLL